MISEFDVEELVRGMLELDDEEDVVDALAGYYQEEVTWECFNKIVADLIPLIEVGQSPLTKKTYKGFGANGFFFIKQEA